MMFIKYINVLNEKLAALRRQKFPQMKKLQGTTQTKNILDVGIDVHVVGVYVDDGSGKFILSYLVTRIYTDCFIF